MLPIAGTVVIIPTCSVFMNDCEKMFMKYLTLVLAIRSCSFPPWLSNLLLYLFGSKQLALVFVDHSVTALYLTIFIPGNRYQEITRIGQAISS